MSHEFFYEGGGRRAAVDAIFEGIHRADPRVLLVGAPGCGRTAVLDRFCAEADPEVLVVARVTGDILMSAAQCFDALAASLAAAAGAGDERARLAGAMAEVRAGGRSPVLLVDDAHELGEDARGDVLSLARDAGVALVLAGDETLAALADGASVITLRAFDEEETEDFVAAWLAVGDEDELPSHRAMARLHRQAGGMPGRLVPLLQGGAAERTALLPAGFPLWHLVFTVVAVALLFWLLLRDGGQETAAVAAEPEEIVVPLPHPASSGVPPVAGTVPPDAPVAPVAAADAPAGVASSVVPAAVVAPPVAVAAPVAVNRYTADEAALLQERPGRYTLQLFASFNEQAVRQFRANHPKLGIRLFRTQREDLPWYVAVTGIYRNKEEAKAFAPRLPADVQGLKPWARSIQGIQDELRRRKD